MNFIVDPRQPADSVGQVNARTFECWLIRSRQIMRRPLALGLHVYAREDYEQMRTFLTNDRMSGFAIKPDGDLVNVFSLPKGRGKMLVREAIRIGATKLDCYDGYLPAFYSRLGFVEVGRDLWNDDYAPSAWVKARFGTPDVVYMKLRK